MSHGRGALLLVLYGAAACGAEDEPGAPAPVKPWFSEEASARGLVFHHRSGHGERFWMPEIMGGGGALLDADDDGDLDAYLVQGGRLAPGAPPEGGGQLFENTGGGRFTDVSARAATNRGYGMGAAVGDADEDGDADLYLTNVGPNVLLANEGGLRFSDASARSATAHDGWSTSAAFFDAERDGDLDLFVANYLDWSFAGELPCLNALSEPDYCSPRNYRSPASAVLYVNRGDGSFADASASSGVAARRGTGLGVAVGDVDTDGWLDVFVANDGMKNHLWQNLGSVRFEERALRGGCGIDAAGQEKAGMGVVLADLDRDLDLDLLVCNLAGETDSFYAYEKGYFVDRTALTGIALPTKHLTHFGVGCFDFDHDGELDLYVAAGRVQAAPEPRCADVYAEENALFRGLAPGRFAEVTPRGGTAPPLVATSRAAIFGDVDGDGAIDVLVVNRDGPAHLLIDRTARGAWVLLDVRERSGRAALGATVQLQLAGRSERREVASAYSYLCANDVRVHVGLGALEGVQGAVVRWVDGGREAFGPLAAGKVHLLRRGAGRAVD